MTETRPAAHEVSVDPLTSPVTGLVRGAPVCQAHTQIVAAV